MTRASRLLRPHPAAPIFRIGHGYDLHRLEPLPPKGNGRPFILGGVRIEHEAGPVAHSDGDTLLHALVDALLGAIAGPDIGRLFPDTDPRFAGADSKVFVKEALLRVAMAGYEVANIDATVVCEQPKIGPHKDAIREHIAGLLNIDASRVGLKGKTHEKVDAVGEGRAVEAHVVVLLQQIGASRAD